MKSVCFFNNKGGVGKTTLICNISSYLAKVKNQRILLVDADPQCNSTQLMLDEDDLELLYKRRGKIRPSASGFNPGSVSTLYDVMQPIALGESKIASTIDPVLGTTTRYLVDLLPGHPKVALLEDQLSQAWVNFGGGDIGGARKTNWNNQLTESLRNKYDLIFFDVGPSLGALNRSVLIGVDYFMTPMGCDVFSMAGVENISAWLKEWLKWYERGVQNCKEKWQDIDIDDEALKEDTSSISRFVGYTVQQYITKSIKGERRATKAYEKILKRIPDVIEKWLGDYVKPGLGDGKLRLGDVPNMFSLVPLAQNANAPIFDLQGADGLVGAQYAQKEEYTKFIANLSESLLTNIKAGGRRGN